MHEKRLVVYDGHEQFVQDQVILQSIITVLFCINVGMKATNLFRYSKNCHTVKNTKIIFAVNTAFF